MKSEKSVKFDCFEKTREIRKDYLRLFSGVDHHVVVQAGHPGHGGGLAPRPGTGEEVDHCVLPFQVRLQRRDLGEPPVPADVASQPVLLASFLQLRQLSQSRLLLLRRRFFTLATCPDDLAGGGGSLNLSSRSLRRGLFAGTGSSLGSGASLPRPRIGTTFLHVARQEVGCLERSSSRHPLKMKIKVSIAKFADIAYSLGYLVPKFDYPNNGN